LMLADILYIPGCEMVPHAEMFSNIMFPVDVFDEMVVVEREIVVLLYVNPPFIKTMTEVTAISATATATIIYLRLVE